MRRWVVGFELHHKLLLSVHQPALSARLGRMTINEGAVLVGHAVESGEHPDQTERCSCYGMPNHWADHLDLARCVALIGEHDLGQAATAMGRCLFHLQRDLLIETWRDQLPTKQWVDGSNPSGGV